MWQDLPVFPESASTYAGEVDGLYAYLVLVSAFFALLIAALVLFFAVRYRRRRAADRGAHIHGSVPLELFWTAVPLAISLSMFGWGAKVYFAQYRPPAEAMDLLVTGKQWMWKVQHPEGQREVNDLHVPVGRPVRLTMASEDVIHSFFVPAFRMKRDVLPGRYTQAWFQATKPGTYHLFCAEYCGAKHSEMVGSVHVMEPAEYERWLAGAPAGETPVAAGERLFRAQRCDTCHAERTGGPAARGPVLTGRFGTAVRLQDGRTVEFDEAYVRRSILEPRADLVEGFEPLMPTYQGQLGEEEILQIVAWLKSLSPGPAEGAPAAPEEPR